MKPGGHNKRGGPIKPEAGHRKRVLGPNNEARIRRLIEVCLHLECDDATPIRVCFEQSKCDRVHEFIKWQVENAKDE